GNQTGAILLYYLVNEKKEFENGVVFNTIVTSDLGAKIARGAGLEVISTLTGFKYIGEQARFLENSKKEFFFGYEESYGYVIKPFVRDKDAFQAMVLCLEVTNFYKLQGKNLLQVLTEIYEKYGYHQEEVVNLELGGSEGAAQIEKIMNYFRNYSSFNFENYQIEGKEDYLKGIKKTKKTVSSLLLPAANVLKFFLEDGSWIILRPSGTEPKLKIYFATVAKSIDNAKDKINDLKKIVKNMIEKVG
ncbi:MAG: phospho-sugar mutase, partial [Bacilli bacterium]|nr:phospho-sugar mutase [Bacilli bacterium]